MGTRNPATIAALIVLLGGSLVRAQTLTLDKLAYTSGEPIRVVWSGSPNLGDRIGLFRARSVPRAGDKKVHPDLWEHATSPFGGMAFTTPLPPGDYVAHLLLKGGPATLTEGVRFKVTYGREVGGIGTRILVGPNDPGGQLADPQVIKVGSTFYITGTYSGAGGYIYSTDDFQTVEATRMEIDTTPWPYPYQHIWAFEVYGHTDGTWHGYAFDFDRKGLYHFVPDPDPKTAEFPVLKWKEKELLLKGDYDNRVITDGQDMYLLTAKGNAGHISVYCQRMRGPGELDPDYKPHKIMSQRNEKLQSEKRNVVGAMKIHECPFIIKVTAPGGTKYVMSYTVGDYGIRDYKIGLAYSDVLIPPRGTEYTKATMADPWNVWGTGANAQEVIYLTQTQVPSWPNYHAAGFNRPGSGDIIEHKGNHYMVYHAAAPLQMDGMVGKRGYGSGRMLWIMPIAFDFTGPIHTWARAELPTDGTVEPAIWPSRTTYAPGQDIVIHYRHAGQSLWDWVGLFGKGESNDSRLSWNYIHGGAKKVPDGWKWERTNYGFSGSLTLAGGLNPTGDYDARLFFHGGKNPVAARCGLNVVKAPNLPPAWSKDAPAAPKATANAAYSHSLAKAAADPEGNDLSYSLLSSPTWLRVAANGDLSGTPPPGFVGVNTFIVGVTDGNGDVIEATLKIETSIAPTD
ncbi:MAG: family 43 glycosylhydrolase [Victivallales bacterium]|jgi:hypothetical protein|nr:family 43 glycosylhydrolase [Victivallales bacterium]MBT7165325.1 family 43 glycosylhydrolase [Victivallales bacterium]MBT7304278.1 family 43 glycosylhydrolase [Victivallales bacterium]